MKTILIAVDESECARSAALWTCSALVDPDSATSIHLAGVSPPIDVAPIAPVGAGTSVVAVSEAIGHQIQIERDRVNALLEDTRRAVLSLSSLSGKREEDIVLHVLAAAGGASGVAESIVALSKSVKPDVVVVGCRGMGSVKRAVMGVVGLGSVSDYLLHHLHGTAVCVVHGIDIKQAKEEKKSRKVLVAVDDSEHAERAEAWALERLIRKEDELHLVAVALPVPYVAGLQFPGPTTALQSFSPGDLEGEYRAALSGAQSIVSAAAERAWSYKAITVDDKIEEEDVASAHVLEQQERQEKIKSALDYANQEVEDAVERAATEYKMDKDRIQFKALEPEGGAGDIGQSVRHYAIENKIDIAVFGARDMGAFKRAMLSFFGLGSVSDWAAHNLECPVVVVKSTLEDSIQDGDKQKTT